MMWNDLQNACFFKKIGIEQYSMLFFYKIGEL